MMRYLSILFLFSIRFIRVSILPFRFLLLLILGLCFISPSLNAQSQIWGLTRAGGQFGAGVIFNTDSIGNNQSIDHSLFQYEGSKPLFTNVIQTTDGMIYGMTYKGGINDLGIIFQYNPVTNAFIKKMDFDGVANGSKPFGSLIQTNNGMLYGLTALGGVNDMGVLFQYDIVTNTYTKKFDFDGAANGRNPHRSLVQASDGNLYGLTAQGGSNDKGVLFQYNQINSSFTKKIDFDSLPSGSNPLGALLEASDGNLYGMTVQGGINNLGVLFQYNTVTNSLVKKIDFDGTALGSNPIGNLMQANDGMLYAITNSGGINDFGVLMQYDPSTNLLTKKLDFDGASNGSKPFGSLMQATDGMLYGMTTLGGINDIGVLFQYNPTNATYIKKHDFTGTTDGRNPYSTLIQANDGMLYGLTNLGGANDIGVLFQYNPTTSNYLKKIDFGAEDGRFPHGSLIQANDGMLYGLTNEGGINNRGVLFQYNPSTYTYTNKIIFDGANNGSNPFGSLMQASDGMLYGTTYSGGINDSGTIFQYNPITSTILKQIDFTGVANGSNPRGALMQTSNGMLYGMTNTGGINNLGVLFQYNCITNTCIKKLDFNGSNNGSNPFGELVQANDGYLYGMTNTGGLNDLGVIFQYNPTTDVYTKLLDFDGTTNGSNPEGSFIQANDGTLYGMTYGGGANNLGLLFQYNISTNTFVKKIDFDGSNNGSNPRGSLMQTHDGMTYGMTYSGGNTNLGVLFQYNITNSTYIKKFNFDGVSKGAKPFSNLIEITNSPNAVKQLDVPNPLSIIIYPNPAINTLTISNIIHKTTIHLYDVLGKLLILKMAEENTTLDISQLPQGVYTLISESDTSKTINKVVITK